MDLQDRGRLISRLVDHEYATQVEIRALFIGVQGHSANTYLISSTSDTLHSDREVHWSAQHATPRVQLM